MAIDLRNIRRIGQELVNLKVCGRIKYLLNGKFGSFQIIKWWKIL